MKFTNKIKISILTVMIAVAGFACSDSSNNDNGGQATINGSVESNDAQKAKVAEGTVVTAARITSSGSFETIEGTETETDASGNFQLEVDAEAAQDIVVVAENNGEEWSGFVAGEVENGQSYSIKPLDAESSAETHVFAEVVSSGNDDIVQKSDIEAAISSRSAASLQGNSDDAEQIAVGLTNSAEARAEFYSEQMGDDAESSLNETYNLMADAQLQLESELDAASSNEQEDEAYEVFFESTVDAFVSAGLDESQSAKAVEMWGRIYTNSLTSVSSDVEDDARANASLMAAIAIDQAVQTEAESTEMSENSIQAIVNAGVELKSDIRDSDGMESDIRASFEAYHDEVRSAMEDDNSFNAALILSIDTQINSTSGSKSDFESSISGILRGSSVVDIYGDFFASVQSTVESNSTGMSDSEIEALTELMILINLSS